MNRTEKLTIIALAVMVSGELVTKLLHLATKSFNGKIYAGYHLFLMLFAVALSFVIFIELRKNIPTQYLREAIWKRVAVLLPIAVVLFSIGEIVNSGFLKFATKVHLYFSYPIYSLSYLVFIAIFIVLSPKNVMMKYPRLTGRWRLWITMLAWPLLTYWGWKEVRVFNLPDVFQYLVGIKIAAVTLMAMTACWLVYVWRWDSIPVAMGAVLIFVSDYDSTYFLKKYIPLDSRQWMWIMHYTGIILLMQVLLLGSQPFEFTGDKVRKMFRWAGGRIGKNKIVGKLGVSIIEISSKIWNKLSPGFKFLKKR